MTPALKLKTPETYAEIWVKLENLNSSGSSKERICSAILSEAEKRGAVRRGKTVIVEATSGNTGIAVAFLCAAKGCGAALFMPEDAAPEKKAIIKAYGAEVFETPAGESIKGAIARAGEFAAQKPRERFFVDQFSNPLNPETHRKTTAREIVSLMEKTGNGKIDAFIMGVGTGGTITGVGLETKKIFPDAEVVAVEPASSAVLSGGKPGGHAISGIGTGFIPDVLDTGVYDTIVAVTDDEARDGVRELARRNGLLAGISSGANYVAAVQTAKKLGPGKRTVTLACDSGDRYLAANGKGAIETRRRV